MDYTQHMECQQKIKWAGSLDVEIDIKDGFKGPLINVRQDTVMKAQQSTFVLTTPQGNLEICSCCTKQLNPV